MIRTGFIYKPAAVSSVGQSDMLFGTTAFANAREPFAQAFKAAGAQQRRASRSSSTTSSRRATTAPRPAGSGDNANARSFGAFNGDRVAPGHPPGGLRRRLRRRRRTSRRSSSPVTSTPPPRKTRCTSSTTAASSRSSTAPGRGSYSFERPLRLPRPRARQPRSACAGDRRRHLGGQRQRDGLLPVQPLQLQRDGLLRPERRSAPRTTTPRSSASTSRTSRRPRRRRSRSSAPTTSTAGCCRTAATPPVRRRSPRRSTSSAAERPRATRSSPLLAT